VFDPNVLTLGFARRFVAYKRPHLLLHDPERLARLLMSPDRPVQLIIAGKAHPEDQLGQELLQDWTRFIRQPGIRDHAVFLEDYDMLLTENLVQGVDVWINTPRRPWEASGTSGMKVLVNGGLNLSVLDGWWAEAYAPEVGWALGDGHDHDDEAACDRADAEALYRLLEEDVIPRFYARDDDGIPRGWLAMMRESMARLTPRFSANRTVREYTERYYVPAARAYRDRVTDHTAGGAGLLHWRHQLEAGWGSVRFGDVTVSNCDGRHVFRVHVYLGELPAEAVSVQLYADARPGDGAPDRLPMTRIDTLRGAVSGYVYEGQAPADRPATDYTPRIVPFAPLATVPLEASPIFWHPGPRSAGGPA
jgi:starch phosphorylase